MEEINEVKVEELVKIDDAENGNVENENKEVADEEQKKDESEEIPQVQAEGDGNETINVNEDGTES